MQAVKRSYTYRIYPENSAEFRENLLYHTESFRLNIIEAIIAEKIDPYIGGEINTYLGSCVAIFSKLPTIPNITAAKSTFYDQMPDTVHTLFNGHIDNANPLLIDFLSNTVIEFEKSNNSKNIKYIFEESSQVPIILGPIMAAAGYFRGARNYKLDKFLKDKLLNLIKNLDPSRHQEIITKIKNKDFSFYQHKETSDPVTTANDSTDYLLEAYNDSINALEENLDLIKRNYNITDENFKRIDQAKLSCEEIHNLLSAEEKRSRLGDRYNRYLRCLDEYDGIKRIIPQTPTSITSESEEDHNDFIKYKENKTTSKRIREFFTKTIPNFFRNLFTRAKTNSKASSESGSVTSIPTISTTSPTGSIVLRHHAKHSNTWGFAGSSSSAAHMQEHHPR